ncbi:MAG: carboxypeptidase regulatory-like domain-containing protein, partial [Terracidiphilus sp.]
MAQSTYGTLLGRVTDTSGAVVPKASVVATNQNTGVSRSGATNGTGRYVLPNLLGGTYQVSVKKSGFKDFVKTGVILESRAIVRVDATLQLGSTQTTVRVTAAPPVITTETGTVTHIESNNVIEQLPTNYRATDTSPLNAVVTIPGVNVDRSKNISIGGDNQTQNAFTVDGFPSNAVEGNGPVFEQFPSTEAVSEMQVITETPPAEYGEMANVEFSTKSGTDRFHG